MKCTSLTADYSIKYKAGERNVDSSGIATYVLVKEQGRWNSAFTHCCTPEGCMTTSLRKFALTAHVTSSVGWLGAVGGFLALAIAGLSSQDEQIVRAAYISMELITWFVIVPLAFASLLTGLIESLGTPWGLFRHYWVLAKFLITIFATLLLLLHTQPIGRLADVARETTLSSADLGRPQIQLVADAGAALLALLVATTLAVYKPGGMTPYGLHKQNQQRGISSASPLAASTPKWAYLTGYSRHCSSLAGCNRAPHRPWFRWTLRGEFSGN
jgi:hypothetical protein